MDPITFTERGRTRCFYRTGPNTAPLVIPGYVTSRGQRFYGTLQITGDGFRFTAR